MLPLRINQPSSIEKMGSCIFSETSLKHVDLSQCNLITEILTMTFSCIETLKLVMFPSS